MKFIGAIILIFPLLASANTSTYVCNYTSYSDQDGNHKVTEQFVLTFIYDKEANKSYMVGNNGSTELTHVPSSKQLSFIEVTATGNIMTTAIDCIFC